MRSGGHRRAILTGMAVVAVLVLVFFAGCGQVKTPGPSENGGQAEPAGPSASLSISCETILSNMDRCDPSKKDYIPEDGRIFGPESFGFEPGETVFDLLKRVCADKGIHMEFTKTPMYDCVYIEGIANIYEFDVGELSGWMYSVNGEFPSFGCSNYTLEDGDAVAFVYTCDLGADVGGNYAAQTEEGEDAGH